MKVGCYLRVDHEFGFKYIEFDASKRHSRESTWGLGLRREVWPRDINLGATGI